MGYPRGKRTWANSPPSSTQLRPVGHTFCLIINGGPWSHTYIDLANAEPNLAIATIIAVRLAWAKCKQAVQPTQKKDNEEKKNLDIDSEEEIDTSDIVYPSVKQTTTAARR